MNDLHSRLVAISYEHLVENELITACIIRLRSLEERTYQSHRHTFKLISETSFIYVIGGVIIDCKDLLGENKDEMSSCCLLDNYYSLVLIFLLSQHQP